MVASALLVSTAPTTTAPSSIEAPTTAAPTTAPTVAACPTVTHRIPAGWYPDRENPARRRWWSGTEWTEHYAMAGAALAAEPRPVIPSPRHSAATGPQPVAVAPATEISRTRVPLIVTVLLAALTGADAVLLCLLALSN
jgi:hypothetical protein